MWNLIGSEINTIFRKSLCFVSDVHAILAFETDPDLYTTMRMARHERIWLQHGEHDLEPRADEKVEIQSTLDISRGSHVEKSHLWRTWS